VGNLVIFPSLDWLAAPQARLKFTSKLVSLLRMARAGDSVRTTASQKECMPEFTG